MNQAQMFRKVNRRRSPQELLQIVLELARENPDTHFVETDWAIQFPNQSPTLSLEFPDQSSAEFEFLALAPTAGRNAVKINPITKKRQLSRK